MFTMQILIVRKKVRMATRRLIKNKIIIFTLLFFFAMQIHPNAVWTKYSAGGIIFKKIIQSPLKRKSCIYLLRK